MLLFGVGKDGIGDSVDRIGIVLIELEMVLIGKKEGMGQEMS